MKTLIAVMALFVSAGAQADIIKCTFTEPFVSVQYSMTQSKLTVEYPKELYPPSYSYQQSAVSFQILDAGYFELWDSKNKTVMQLSLDYNGSDGMSDYVYPYSAYWNGLHGGCTSNFLHKSLKKYQY